MKKEEIKRNNYEAPLSYQVEDYMNSAWLAEKYASQENSFYHSE